MSTNTPGRGAGCCALKWLYLHRAVVFGEISRLRGFGALPVQGCFKFSRALRFL